MPRDPQDFQALQQHFAQHLRDPEKTYDPQAVDGDAIEPRRLAIYESLFFNNFDSLLSNMFPVMQRLVGPDHWARLVRRFMQHHGARTPYFHQLGQEWLRFLQTDSEVGEDKDQFPFLQELAHYEWVELAVSIEPFDPSPFSGVRIDQDPVLQLSPLVWPLHYDWPVHRIGADSDPQTIQPAETWLLVHRDSEDRVHFAEITSAVFALMRRFAGAEKPVSEVVENVVSDLTNQQGTQTDLNADQIMEAAATLIPQWLENQWLVATPIGKPHPIEHSESLQSSPD
jgi:hypothetical protein